MVQESIIFHSPVTASLPRQIFYLRPGGAMFFTAGAFVALDRSAAERYATNSRLCLGNVWSGSMDFPLTDDYRLEARSAVMEGGVQVHFSAFAQVDASISRMQLQLVMRQLEGKILSLPMLT